MKRGDGCQLGSEKGLKKMKITTNLVILTKLGQSCELLIYRSSSAMFKLRVKIGPDDIFRMIKIMFYSK